MGQGCLLSSRFLFRPTSRLLYFRGTMRNTLPFFVLLFIFGAIVAALVVPPSAAAQSNSCIAYASCGYSSIGGPCTPTIPSGAYDCQGANFTLTCKLHTYHCPPAKSHVEHPRCIECEKLAAAGKPINLANGNVYVDQTDLSIPGLGGGLTLTRAWNSLWPTTQFNYRTGMFGPNWVIAFFCPDKALSCQAKSK